MVDGPGQDGGTLAGPGDGRRGRPAVGASTALAWLLVVSGALGLLASFVITVDKMKLAENPAFHPACSINPVISCGSVMLSPQASVFGFANPLLGLAAYAAVTATGVALLAGVRYPRWYWLGLNAGMLLGAAFCMWLMTQALYEIGALCLWCCLAWAVTIAMFAYTTLHNLKHRLLPAPRAAVMGLLEFHWVIPVTWYLGIVALIAVRFWTYWRTLL